jgi:hypothetical protein
MTAAPSALSLAERIARGRAAVERAQTQGRDTTSWEQHLAQLEAQQSALLQKELDILLSIIADGCRLGLHEELDRVPEEVITAVLDAHDGPEAEYLATCRRAGGAALLAVAVQQYRLKLRRLAIQELIAEGRGHCLADDVREELHLRAEQHLWRARRGGA